MAAVAIPSAGWHSNDDEVVVDNDQVVVDNDDVDNDSDGFAVNEPLTCSRSRQVV